MICVYISQTNILLAVCVNDQLRASFFAVLFLFRKELYHELIDTVINIVALYQLDAHAVIGQNCCS